MTDYRCFGKCMKNCEKRCHNSSDHTNKNCHLKRFCCCYTHSPCKFTVEECDLPEPKVCELCFCLLKNCVCLKKNQHRESRHKKLQCNKHSEKETSLEQKVCELCYRLVKNCKCRCSSPELIATIRGPRTLCEDLPLYDEKSHLIGYIKRGAVIDEPSCARSRDLGLENGSVSATVLRPQQLTMDHGCMASCRYAEGVRSDNRATKVSCWTTRSAFNHATTGAGETTMQHKKHRPRRNHCPCSK